MSVIEIIKSKASLLTLANDAENALSRLSSQAIEDRNFLVAERATKLHTKLVNELFEKKDKEVKLEG